MSFLQKLLALLTRDLTGRTWVHEQDHPHFGRMLYFGTEGEEGYWEASVPISEEPGETTVTFTGTPEGPTAGEEAFCRQLLSDLDALFERCRAAFDEHYETWAERPMPSDWRETFELDGITLPPDGAEDGAWDVCWFVDPANHWFIAWFEDGRVTDVSVDG